MKFIIIGILLTIIVAAAAFFCGYTFAEKDDEIMFKTLQAEHNALAEKLDTIDKKCDGIARIEMLIRQNMSSPFNNDK